MQKTPLWKHFSAFLYDIFPILGVFLLTSLAILLIRNGIELERFTPWFMILLFSELAFYYIYSWKKGGQTIGMKAWKIKIVPNQKNQMSLSWNQALTRFLTGMLSTVLIGGGLFWKLFNKTNQSWMDLASDSQTVTVEE